MQACRVARKEDSSVLPLGCRGKVMFLAALLSGLCGCMGPMGIAKTRTNYNEAIRRTNDEELLLNLVRLRFGDSPNFLTITGVNAQFEMDAATGFRAGPERGGLDAWGSGNLGYADRPTVTMSPQRSSTFVKALMTHISLDTLLLLSTTISDAEVLDRLFIRDVNGLENTPGEPGFEEFLHFASLLRILQQQRTAVLELEPRQLDVPDAPPFESLSALEMVKIKEAGYGVRSLGEKKGYVLTKTTHVRGLRILPEAIASPEILELARVLRLRPGLPFYELEDAPQGQLRPSALEEQRTRITMTTRSVLEVMFLLSEAVPLPNGSCDQNHMLGDLFRIHVSKDKPKDAAAVAVCHDGCWYFIACDDITSKSTLRLFSQVFRLERIGDPENAPLLSLPVGR
jgi:hypothetical protein